MHIPWRAAGAISRLVSLAVRCCRLFYGGKPMRQTLARSFIALLAVLLATGLLAPLASTQAAADTDLGLANVPANITTNATSPAGAVVTYTPPTVVDEAGDSPAATVACNHASG